MPKKVLAIGIDPAFVDFAAMPQFTPQMFRAFIDAELDRVRASGYDVTSCLIDLGDTAEAVTTKALTTVVSTSGKCSWTMSWFRS